MGLTREDYDLMREVSFASFLATLWFFFMQAWRKVFFGRRLKLRVLYHNGTSQIVRCNAVRVVQGGGNGHKGFVWENASPTPSQGVLAVAVL